MLMNQAALIQGLTQLKLVNSKRSVTQGSWNRSLIFRSVVDLWSYAAGDITI